MLDKSVSRSRKGIPGTLLAFLKRCLRFQLLRYNTKYKDSIFIFRVALKVFNGYLGIEDKDKFIKFDLPNEMGILHEFGRQAVPVNPQRVYCQSFTL
jgi:hypothetical protein